MTERQRQERNAFAFCEHVYRWHFVCLVNDLNEYTFSAIAPSRSGALRVLNAERPGIDARFDDCTSVPVQGNRERVYGGEVVRAADGTPLVVEVRA